MAGRHQKIKLAWYQEEPDFWDDPRFRSARNLYGYLSYVIYKSLHDMIFLTNGYFVNYKTEREKADVLYWLRQRLVGPGLPSAEKVDDVIRELVACGLFDGDLFRHGVITSHWAQECFYRGTAKRKNVSVNTDIWLLSVDEMKSISANNSILSFFISSGTNGISDVNNSISDGTNIIDKIREDEITEDKITLHNITSEGKEETPLSFSFTYEEKFYLLFGRKPDASHVKAVDNLRIKGKPPELLLEALESLKGKRIREPEPYVYRVLQNYTPKHSSLPAAQNDDPNRPLEQWEINWLAEMEARRRMLRGLDGKE